MPGNNMQCEVQNQYTVTGPLEAESFTASRFAGISRNYNCAGGFFVSPQESVTDICLDGTDTAYMLYTAREYGYSVPGTDELYS